MQDRLPGLLEAVFAASADALVVADTQMRFVAANPAACDLFGVVEGDLLGHRISEFSMPEDMPSETFDSFLQAGKMTGEYRIVRPDGETRLTSFTAVSDILPGFHLSILRDLGEIAPLRPDGRTPERTKLALQAGQMGTWEWDLSRERVTWSPELQRVHGLAAGEFDGTFEMARTLVHPLEVEALSDATRTFLKVGSLSVEYRIIRPDGETRWLSVHGKLFNDGSAHAPSFAVGVSTDVTEQKRQHGALSLIVEASRVLASSLDYEATLKAVAELAVPELADWCSVYVLNDQGMSEIVALHHRDPEKISWVQELLRRYPPDPDAPGGVPSVLRSGQSMLMKSVPPELYAALDEEQLAVVEALNVCSYMCVAMETRGQIFGAIAFATAESRRQYRREDLTVAEHIARRAGFAIENALTHREMAREKAKLESIVSSVRYGICHLDAAGRVTYINDAGARIIGRGLAGISGLSACALLHGKLCEQSECVLKEASIGRPFQGQDEFLAATGSHVPVELLASPIIIEDRIEGAALVFHDISERLRDEQAKDDFVAFASHELKSPLTPVLGMANWLSRKAKSAPDQYDDDDREAIETLKAESERLSRVVDTFLDLSRIEAGRLVLNHEPMEVSETVRAEVESLHLRHPLATINVELPDEPIHALSDELRFRQVLANLLENAVKYGAEDCAVVTVEARRDEGANFVVTVRDNGPGIAPMDMPFLFDRFFRSGRDSVQAKKGLGIGLYITKEIVEAADGSITVESQPQAGSTFQVTWPLRPALRPEDSYGG